MQLVRQHWIRGGWLTIALVALVSGISQAWSAEAVATAAPFDAEILLGEVSPSDKPTPGAKISQQAIFLDKDPRFNRPWGDVVPTAALASWHGGGVSQADIYMHGPLLVDPTSTDPNGPDADAPILQNGVVIFPNEAPPPNPCDARRSTFFQRAEFTTTYLPALGTSPSRLGSTDVDGLVQAGLPFPTLNFPLLITAESEAHWLDGPKSTDLPPRLYDEYIDFRWFIHVGEHWIADLAVTPGIHTDFENTSWDSFRMPAHAVAVYQRDATTFFALGVAYLDRDGTNWVPAGGIIWSPTSDWKLELTTPRPKISRLLSTHATPCCIQSQDWLYVAAEFGGDQWAIRRASGADDVITTSDYRAIIGVERKNCQGSISGRLEFGYVFGRKIDYRSGSPGDEPEDTLMARAGFWF